MGDDLRGIDLDRRAGCNKGKSSCRAVREIDSKLNLALLIEPLCGACAGCAMSDAHGTL